MDCSPQICFVEWWIRRLAGEQSKIDLLTITHLQLPIISIAEYIRVMNSVELLYQESEEIILYPHPDLYKTVLL